MGHCYDNATGKLLCDACDTHEGVRKSYCPFDECFPVALCATCRTKHKDKLTRVAHQARGCETALAKSRAHEQEKAELLKAGKSVRCAALGIKDTERVHVLFLKPDGATEGRYMSAAAYRAVPIMANATLEDFAKFGTLEPAPSDFDLENMK